MTAIAKLGFLESALGALGHVSSQIWDFLSSPKFFKILFRPSWYNSNAKFVTCHVSFYLWWIELVPKQCKKALRYYDQDCLEIFVLHSTPEMMIQVSKQSTHLAQKASSIKKLWMSKVERFLKLNFDLNQI